jgi:flagellar L-ring protein precursor FlgH
MRYLLLIAALSWLAPATPALAQNSRLFDRPLSMPMSPQAGVPGVPYGPTIDNSSWITVPLPPPREIRVNDIVTIRVDITARAVQEGDFQRRKNATFDSLLRNWVTLEGLTQIKPAPQSEGDQRITGTLNKQDRITSELETSESLKFEIAATVASILPNGNVVLEAHRKVTNNEETWLQSLTGVCPKDAIGPGNIVLSKDIAQLDIKKEELGSIKDSYKRGWFQRAWDLLKVF